MTMFNKDDQPEYLSLEQLEVLCQTEPDALLHVLRKNTQFDPERIRLILEMGMADAKRRLAQRTQAAQALRPLPAGTVIEYCGDRATVVRDDGGSSLTVDCGEDGFQKWAWTLEGVTCTVISLPGAAA